MLIKITFYIYTVYSLIIHSLYLSNDKLINDNHTGWLNPGDILASLYNHLPVLFDNSQSVVHLCFLISHLIQAAMFMINRFTFLATPQTNMEGLLLQTELYVKSLWAVNESTASGCDIKMKKVLLIILPCLTFQRTNTAMITAPIWTLFAGHYSLWVLVYVIRSNVYLLQQVSLLDGLQHIFLGCLLCLSTQEELIQDKVGLLKVEDDVQLAHLEDHKHQLRGQHLIRAANLWGSPRSLYRHCKELYVLPKWLTLPKYLSSSSTYLWMISSVMSSLSWSSTAQQKYRLAYLQYKGKENTLKLFRQKYLLI